MAQLLLAAVVVLLSATSTDTAAEGETKPHPAPHPIAAAVSAPWQTPVAIGVPKTKKGWPGFRGRTGSGVSAEALDPARLAPAVAWRAKVGSGFSGVSVAGGKAITMFEDGDQYVIAFDAATGEELWRRRIGESFPGRDGSWNGPVSTPVIHGDLVVALEPWGRLFALDTTDGRPVWSVDLAAEPGALRPAYGFGSSPLVVDDTLVVHGGGPRGTVFGFDVASGEARWAVGTEPVLAPSPVTLTLAGRSMVVASGQEHVFGIDPGSGEVLWEYAHEGAGYRGEGSLVPVGLDGGRIFLAHDDDASQVIGVRREGDGFAVERVWLDRVIRNSYNVAVHHGGYIYAYSARLLVCVDAATGELEWRSRSPGDGFITLVGDTLVILTKAGTLHAVRATPEGYHELASAAIFDELSWAMPSVAYGASSRAASTRSSASICTAVTERRRRPRRASARHGASSRAAGSSGVSSAPSSSRPTRRR